MKKIYLVAAIAILLLSYSAIASAKAGDLPAGAYICATCNGDNTATLKITGVKVEEFEEYPFYKDKVVVDGAGGDAFEISANMDAWRRFNFKHSGGLYGPADSGIKKSSPYGGASFLGPNVDIDDEDPKHPGHKNPNGACYVITCPTVKIMPKVK